VSALCGLPGVPGFGVLFTGVTGLAPGVTGFGFAFGGVAGLMPGATGL